jgi:hypothetical protein
MTGKLANLMLVAVVACPCHDKLWEFFYHYVWLWGGKH